MSRRSVAECLRVLGVSPGDLSAAASMEVEFVIIKKFYHISILRNHPDKGGQPAAFREVQVAFESVRDLFARRAIVSFKSATSAAKFVDVYVDDDDDDEDGEEGGDEWEEDWEEEEWEEEKDKPKRKKGVRGKRRKGSSSSSSSSSAWYPWEFYEQAALDEVPLYRVEPAKSNRSKCSASGKACRCDGANINQNELRCGSLNAEAGTYTRWTHLRCWRVPQKIWLGLQKCTTEADVDKALSTMNEVLFCGYCDLSEAERQTLVLYVMDRSNWAAAGKISTPSDAPPAASTSSSSSTSSAPPPPPALAHSAASSSSAAVSSASVLARLSKAPDPSSSLVSNGFFIVPVPGVNGAQPHFLDGKTVVLTGVFPEVGGGAGLGLGKERTKKMCEAFGARVVSAVSGKTDILLVGKAPGAKKVGDARKLPRCQLISLRDLRDSIEGKTTLAIAPAAEISKFSKGFAGNGIAKNMSRGELAVLRGDVEIVMIDDTPPSKATSKRKLKEKEEEEEDEGEGEDGDEDSGSSEGNVGGSGGEDIITCDSCGIDCTAQSWLYCDSDQCNECISANDRETAQLLRNGVSARW